MTQTALRILAALALSASLSGCLHADVPGAVEDARTPTQQFRAEVSTRPQEIRLAVHAQGLSRSQAAALADFVEVWREGGGGPVTVRAPSGAGPDPGAAFRTAEGARAELAALGVPTRQIELTGYSAAGAADAPVVVDFLRHEVSVPDCGQQWTNLAHSAGNRVQPNFGCAVTANMAAQIAEPADLLGARTMDPADAGRRQTVIDKYRKGQLTSSERDDKASGAVSQAVQ